MLSLSLKVDVESRWTTDSDYVRTCGGQTNAGNCPACGGRGLVNAKEYDAFRTGLMVCPVCK